MSFADTAEGIIDGRPLQARKYAVRDGIESNHVDPNGGNAGGDYLDLSVDQIVRQFTRLGHPAEAWRAGLRADACAASFGQMRVNRMTGDLERSVIGGWDVVRVEVAA